MGRFKRGDQDICQRRGGGLSQVCQCLETRWDRGSGECVLCPKEPGNEVTPNCGYSDDGGRHQVPYTECKNNTFNPGTWYYCKNCSVCPSGFVVIQPCNSTTDTQCQVQSSVQTTTVSVTKFREGGTSSKYSAGSAGLLWATPLIMLIVLLLALSAYIFYMKRKRGPGTAMEYRKRSSLISDEFPQFTAVSSYDLKDNFSSEILSAPLQTVMDNLDVLEKLVILLDPESPGVKNTKHLASHCSFSSAWINYTYSMKESKSPLKAVLEGVTSRHPDWTVGHLAKLLKQMERNDALTVLTQLRLHEMAM